MSNGSDIMLVTGDEEEEYFERALETPAFSAFQDFLEGRGYDIEEDDVVQVQPEGGSPSYLVSFRCDDGDPHKNSELVMEFRDEELVYAGVGMDHYHEGELVQPEGYVYDDGEIYAESIS